MLLLRGKLRLLHKMRSVPNPPPHPPGAELQNRRGGGLAHSDETDRLEFHLSQKVKQLFLGYLPVERDAWETELARNRSRYAELKDELLANPSESSRTKGEASTSNKRHAKNDDDGLLSRREVFNGNHPLSLGNGSVWHQFFKSNAEADSFSCFVRLLSGSVDHFCQQLDDSSVGIHSTLSHLSELLKINDEELWQHLENTKVNPQFYAFRWITLLLTQEFKFHSTMRIWDCLLSNPWGVQEMLLRVCCAMLLCAKHELLNGDFASNLKLLQHYPEIDLETLLDVACHLIPCSPTLLLHC